VVLADLYGFCKSFFMSVLKVTLVKVEGKIFLCWSKHHTMKVYGGSGGIAERIFNLDTRWRRVVSLIRRPLYPRRKGLQYPFDRKLGGPQSQSGRGGEEKNSQPPPGIEPDSSIPHTSRFIIHNHHTFSRSYRNTVWRHKPKYLDLNLHRSNFA
jgi:hypothetical protein